MSYWLTGLFLKGALVAQAPHSSSDTNNHPKFEPLPITGDQTTAARALLREPFNTYNDSFGIYPETASPYPGLRVVVNHQPIPSHWVLRVSVDERKMPSGDPSPRGNSSPNDGYLLDVSSFEIKPDPVNPDQKVVVFKGGAECSDPASVICQGFRGMLADWSQQRWVKNPDGLKGFRRQFIDTHAEYTGLEMISSEEFTSRQTQAAEQAQRKADEAAAVAQRFHSSRVIELPRWLGWALPAILLALEGLQLAVLFLSWRRERTAFQRGQKQAKTELEDSHQQQLTKFEAKLDEVRSALQGDNAKLTAQVDRAIVSLRNDLQHHMSIVRGHAATSLAEIEETRAIGWILPLCMDSDPLVRAETKLAVLALINTSLLETLLPPNEISLRALNLTPHSLEDLLILTLGHSDLDCSSHAIEALGTLRVERAREPLCLLLARPFDESQKKVVKALAKIGAADAIGELAPVEILEPHLSAMLADPLGGREQTIEKLELDNAKGFNALLNALLSRAHPSVLQMRARCIAWMLGQLDFLESLPDLLRSEDKAVRAATVDHLKRRGFAGEKKSLLNAVQKHLCHSLESEEDFPIWSRLLEILKSLADKSDPLLGTTLVAEEKNVSSGREYVVEVKLAEGGMGAVYVGRDTDGRYVAIKTILPKALSDLADLSKVSDLLARFSREIASLKTLSSPHIVRVEATGKINNDPERPFVVMEFIIGETLGKRLRHLRRGQKSLETPKAISVAIHVLKALEETHGKEIIHRDLKPDNIKLRNGDGIKLIDFGLAKSLSTDATEITQEAAALGTLSYMSPEQILGAREVDHRSDLYSVGVILYEMLAGRRPFESNAKNNKERMGQLMRQILDDTPPSLVSLADPIPQALSDLVDQALAKDPINRPQTASEFLQRLEIIERGLA